MRKQQRQKNIVVAALAICAVGFVAWTLVSSGAGRRRYTRPAPAPAPGADPNAQASSALPAAAGTQDPAKAATPGVPLVPVQSIDFQVVHAQYGRWVESPARDPFQVVLAAAPKSEGPRAADILSLRAIWRQSGGRLAVINSQVLAEGDRIAGFNVERIDANQVWVRGTNGAEHIDFKVGTPAAARSPQGPRATGQSQGPATSTTSERRLSP
jgi:hypothetical protein